MGEHHRGKGLMTKALSLLIQELKQNYPIKILFAGADHVNPASQKVLTKNGFKKIYEYSEIPEKRLVYWYERTL